MESYYTNQASPLPYFSGNCRKRGSGFGALASGIGRIVLPLLRLHIIFPAAERFRKELLLQSVLELVDVVSKIKSKAGAEKHSFEYSQRANRRLLSTANETTKPNISETV